MAEEAKPRLQRKMMAEVRIEEFFDYRGFLKACYLWRKASRPAFSIRFMAQRLEKNAAYVSRVLNGRMQITLEVAEDFILLFDLQGKDALQFRLLVQLARSRSSIESQDIWARLATLRGLHLEEMDEAMLRFYSDWRHAVIRALLGLGCPPSELAERMPHPAAERSIRESIALLQELGMVHEEAEGTFQVPQAWITAGRSVQPATIRAYQKQWIELASQALETIEPEMRDMSTLTLTFSGVEFDEARQILKETRDRLLVVSRRARGHRKVYQLNLQLFPVSK